MGTSIKTVLVVAFTIGVTAVSDAIGMNTTTCDVGVACDKCPQSLVFEHTNKKDRVCCKNCATTAIEYGSVPSDWCICRSSNTKMPDSVKLPLPPAMPPRALALRRVGSSADAQDAGPLPHHQHQHHQHQHQHHQQQGPNQQHLGGGAGGGPLAYEFVDSQQGGGGGPGGVGPMAAERRFGALTATAGERRGYGPTFFPASAGIGGGSSGRIDGPSRSGSGGLSALTESKLANLRSPPSFGSGSVDISSVRLLKDVADDLYGAFAHVLDKMKEMEKMHDEMLRLEERVYRLENDVGRNYNSLDRSDSRGRPPMGSRDSLLGREGHFDGGRPGPEDRPSGLDDNCPRGFHSVPRLRACFHFSTERLVDWYGAQTNCMRMVPGSRLAEFDTVNEYDEVVRFMDKKFENARQPTGRRGEFLWIGAKRELRDYLWETTQKMVDPSFDRKIENGYTSFSGSRSCLAVTRADSRAEYRLEGITCANPSGYICQLQF